MTWITLLIASVAATICATVAFCLADSEAVKYVTLIAAFAGWFAVAARAFHYERPVWLEEDEY